jgi:hypothetical protein
VRALSYPPPRQKVCKVLEAKDIRLDFDLTSYDESKARRGPGFRFPCLKFISGVNG